MSSYTGLSPKQPNRYVGKNVYLSSVVTRNREPTSADYRQPETGKLYPTGSFWLVGENPTTGTQGEYFYLSKIVANVAYWVRIGTGIFPGDRVCFMAYKSGPTNNATGDDTYVTIVFDTVTQDTGSNYNNSTGIFTAPVDGTYLFIANCGYNGINSFNTRSNINIIAGGIEYQGPNFNALAVSDTGSGLIYSFSCMVPLTANQTAYVETAMFGNATKNVNILGYSTFTSNLTFFNGLLVN